MFMVTLQNVDLESLTPLRILFGFFPTYRSSPLAPAFDRVLQARNISLLNYRHRNLPQAMNKQYFNAHIQTQNLSLPGTASTPTIRRMHLLENFWLPRRCSNDNWDALKYNREMG